MAIETATRVQSFNIEIAGGGTSTTALYVGGFQQCQVVINIVKQKQNEGGIWIADSLTTAEKSSVTVVEFSTDTGARLPAGWACDTVKNEFDMGLWSQQAEGQPSEHSGVDPVINPVPVVSPIESINRFMRFMTGPAINQRFMARVVVGGVTYTTNMTVEGITYSSWVYIRPTSPYALPVERLQVYHDTSAYSTQGVDVDVYYWTPPLGLRFVRNLGGMDPILFKDTTVRGNRLHTSYTYDIGHGIRRIGGILTGETVDNITMENLLKKSSAGNAAIPANKRSTIMRAVRVTAWLDHPNEDRQARNLWRLVDNYGCLHNYFISWGDNRNVLVLYAA